LPLPTQLQILNNDWTNNS